MRRTLSSSVSCADFVGREPADFVRFVADADLLAGVGDEQEADVVVLVGVFDQLACRVVAGRDLVHVDVERHQHAVDRHDIEAASGPIPRGLRGGRLPRRATGRRHGRRAAASDRACDDASSRQRRRSAETIQAAPVMWPGRQVRSKQSACAFDQRADAVDDRGFGGKGRAIAGQHVEQRPAVHGEGVSGVRCQVSGVSRHYRRLQP